MKAPQQLILSQDDYQKISALLDLASDDIAEFLEEELNRAAVMSLETLPKEVVAINSEVRFIDLNTNKESIVTLVYPNDANIEAKKISVLSPVGAALIGLKAGQTIKAPLDGGKLKDLKIISVKQTPA